MDTPITLLSENLSERRALSLEEMEQVSGGETMRIFIAEWYLMVMSYKYPMARGPLK